MAFLTKVKPATLICVYLVVSDLKTSSNDFSSLRMVKINKFSSLAYPAMVFLRSIDWSELIKKEVSLMASTRLILGIFAKRFLETRSEERRVGKECRSRWSWYD